MIEKYNGTTKQAVVASATSTPFSQGGGDNDKSKNIYYYEDIAEKYKYKLYRSGQIVQLCAEPIDSDFIPVFYPPQGFRPIPLGRFTIDGQLTDIGTNYGEGEYAVGPATTSYQKTLITYMTADDYPSDDYLYKPTS